MLPDEPTASFSAHNGQLIAGLLEQLVRQRQPAILRTIQANTFISMQIKS